MRIARSSALVGWLPFVFFVAGLAFFSGCASRPPLPPQAAELNRTGAAALAAGDLATAEARLGVALEYSPRFTEAWVNLGLVELRQGNPDAARERILKARNLNPDLPTPHHGLGLVAEHRGRKEEAEKHYRAALKVDPGFYPARANLGRLLYARGAYEEAKEQFLRQTEVAPESVDGWLGLIESYLRLGRERDSDVALNRANELFGAAPGIRLLEGRRLLRRGSYEDAAQTFEELTHVPDRAREGAAWAWLAVARLAQGDREGARSAAARAAKIDPSDSVVHYVNRTLSSAH